MRAIDLAAAFACLALGACSTENGGMVGPEGGTVSVTEAGSPIYGVKAVIPAGALPRKASVVLRSPESAAGLPEMQPGLAAFTPVVELVTDVPFAADVQLVFPTRGAALREDQILSGFRAEEGTWGVFFAERLDGASFSVTTGSAGVWRWGLTLVRETKYETLKPALDRTLGPVVPPQVEPAAQAEFDALVADIRSKLPTLSNCDVFGIALNVILDARAAVEAKLHDDMAASGCGACDLTDKEFVSQLVEYYQIKGRAFMADLFISMAAPNGIVEMIAQWMAASYYHHLIHELDCNFECLANNPPPGYWAHAASYGGCQLALVFVYLLMIYSGCPG